MPSPVPTAAAAITATVTMSHAVRFVTSVPAGRPRGEQSTRKRTRTNRGYRAQTGSGVFWARVPLRRRVVVTKVENPAKEPAALEIHVNGDRTGDAEQIPSGVVLDVARPIPAGGGALSIGYTGDKRLILLETHFR